MRGKFSCGLFAVATLVACHSADETPRTEQASATVAPTAGEKVAIEELDVAAAADFFEKKLAVPVDANGDKTRAERGVVPDAILLTSSGRYDAAKELPEDKNTGLVFYCGSTHCTASDGAAERAQEAGYTNVKVMRPGIKGWVEAGKSVSKPTS